MKKDNGTLIEKYLDGELSPEDVISVENMIKTDAEFAQEFYLRKDVNDVLSQKKIVKMYLNLKKLIRSIKKKK
ncbi:MAG: hypothetical protein A2033_12770 [Bacteroidetes bacterium GWA2_31_9]|nr:MAG: hypothetical protein A2033_12770 [Bacteroidetes bacterium GWA2_31_9]